MSFDAFDRWFTRWMARPGVLALMPLVLFPSLAFRHFRHAPTMEAQYSVENLVLIAAGIVIGATVRGGRLSAQEPAVGRRGSRARIS